MLIINRFGIIKIEGVKVIRNFAIDLENIAIILCLFIISKSYMKAYLSILVTIIFIKYSFSFKLCLPIK